MRAARNWRPETIFGIGHYSLFYLDGLESLLYAVTGHFEDVANLLIELGPYFANFSKCALMLRAE